jgi:hypothetical protein
LNDYLKIDFLRLNKMDLLDDIWECIFTIIVREYRLSTSFNAILLISKQTWKVGQNFREEAAKLPLDWHWVSTRSRDWKYISWDLCIKDEID